MRRKSLLLSLIALSWAYEVPLWGEGIDINQTVYEDRDGRLEYRFTRSVGERSGGVQVLVWKRNDGQMETVFEKPVTVFGAEKPNAVIRKDEQMAIIAGSSIGLITYELYERRKGGWTLKVESPLGMPPKDAAGGEFVSLKEYRQFREAAEPMNFEITDIPLEPQVPNSRRRLALANGKPHRALGVDIGGAVWDQPLNKILKEDKERRGDSDALGPHSQPDTSTNRNHEPLPTLQDAPKAAQNIGTTEHLWSYWPTGAAVTAVVAVILLLWRAYH